LSFVLMMKGARKLVEVCAGVRPGEQALVVTDHPMAPIGEVISAAAAAAGAEPIVCTMVPRRADGTEPPPAVVAAMNHSQVIFTPVSVSITHTQAIRGAVAQGSRALALTAFNPGLLISGAIDADFAAQKPVCQAVARKFAQGKKAHLTNPAGTDLTLDLEGRRGNALVGMVEPGQFAPALTIEANFSPTEGTSQGIIVADASIPYEEIGVLSEPVRMKVENGLITSVDGGRQARSFAHNLERHGDPNAYNVAELGVGLNPVARMMGVMLEDEAVCGTAHIGIGTNITLGGTVKAACHYDAIMWRPTLTVDGEFIIRDGEVLVKG